MKVKYVEQTEVTSDDLSEFNNRLAETKKPFVTANDLGMNKRIIAINLSDDHRMVLVNPTFNIKSEAVVVYPEMDSVKPKRVRKTIRHVQFIVSTDNLGDVEFSADRPSWGNLDELMGDSGLFEAVMVQRMIDAIDGIDVTSPKRRYNQPLTTRKKVGSEWVETTSNKVIGGRNERVMMQNEKGDTVFVKRKVESVYAKRGYRTL
jgi:hypothetical protein